MNRNVTHNKSLLSKIRSMISLKYDFSLPGLKYRK